MKLWVVHNGFGGFGSCKVYVIAETGERAIEMAKDVYEKTHDNLIHVYNGERYSIYLEAELLCDDTTKEWVASKVTDD